MTDNPKTQERELLDLTAHIRAWQEARKLNDSAMLRRFVGLGSTKTYSRLLKGDVDQMDIERQLANYRAVWALIESIGDADERGEDAYDDLSGVAALRRVLLEVFRENGNGRFILVEGEDYADTLTAERVRRAIKGYAWVGTQRETLLEQKITFTQFKKADEWLKKVEAIKAREGFAEGDLADQGKPRQMRFDKISIKLDDGMLRVEGEKRIAKRVEGLGGEFSYCTLGEPVELEKLLSGERLPAFDALGAWLFYTATGGSLPPMPKDAAPWYLGEAKDRHVWLLYRPELAFLKSPEAALTLTFAKTLHAWAAARGDGKGHLVFAPAKYLSNRQLLDHGVSYAPLPCALYRES